MAVMSKRTIYIIAGIGCAILAVKTWTLAPEHPEYWVVTIALFALWAVVLGLAIAKSRSRANPPKDGPEADYHDHPE